MYIYRLKRARKPPNAAYINQKVFENELVEFKNQYEKISGLQVPLKYLVESQVFGFKKGNQLIGGFVLSSNSKLRTVEVFVFAKGVFEIVLSKVFKKKKARCFVEKTGLSNQLSYEISKVI